METIELPSNKGFTVYSKSGCPNCKLVKIFIKEKNFLIHTIDCDEYLIENKEIFLQFIESYSGKKHNVFPIVFYDEKYIGSYTDTIDFIDKLLLSFESNF